MVPVVEDALHEIGFNKIAGVDESGRGSLMGPVVVACVMLSRNHKLEGLDDSKKLSAKKREHLFELIYEQALDVQIAFGSNGMIDEFNIYRATKKCIKETLDNFKISPEMVVIDGTFTPFIGEEKLLYPHQMLPKADSLSENVAAASIIAKVSRDRWIIESAYPEYPQYGFDKHKGYGTKKHVEALQKYGPCPLHRVSFSLNGKKISDM